MGKIYMSKKHGLNPSIDVCFFCGKDKAILVFGKMKGDAKAPQRVVSNYKPCEECEKKMRSGRAVIEVTTTDTGALPIIEGAWPTGRWCVIKAETALKLFKDNRTTPVLLEDSLYDELVKRNK